MDKQIMEILENRPLIEGLVVGSFLKNLTLYGEFKVSVDDFEYDKMKYLFSLGRAMSENHEELDEASLVSFLNSNKKLQENYEEYGGWDTIKKAINLGNDNNIEAYIDDLAKNNFLLNIREMLGVNVTEEMELYGQTFSPFYDKFGEMKCREVEHFYEGILSSCVVQSINQQVKAENLLITSKDKEKLKQKIDCGLPYDIIFSYTEKEVGLSDNEEVKYIYGLPTLSTITNGLGNGGGISIMAGHSGLGKSTLTFFDFILSMWYRGEKCLIFSNEQQSQYFKSMLYSFIASNIFKYYKLTRRKIDNGDWSEEEDVLIDKITKFLQDRDFENFVTFISLEEFKIDEIMRISKKYITHLGYGCILIDTFKSEDSSSANYTGQVIESAKRLDQFGNKYNIKVVLTMQLVAGNELKNAYLTASDLSEAKAVKTVCDLLFLMRKVVNQLELDENNKKFFLKPYKLVKIGDKWRKRYITFSEEDKEKDYRLLFLNKSRRGDDDVIILLRFNGGTGRFDEVGRCDYCSRGYLTANGK